MIMRNVALKIEGVEQLVLRITLLPHHFDASPHRWLASRASAYLPKFGEFFNTIAPLLSFAFPESRHWRGHSISVSRQCGRARRAYLIRVTGTSTRWITLVATEPIIKLAIGPRPRVPMMIASHCVSWTCRAISLAGEPTRVRAWY